MGGKGSGRHWRWDAKSTVESRRKIDIRHWHKEGLLEPHQLFSRKWSSNGQSIAKIIVYTEPNKLNFICRYRKSTGEWQQIDYPVYVGWTVCRYGGQRPWFFCPAKDCERRAAILYCSGNIYACRRCHQLTYTSQREADYYRAARKADKISKRLGWEGGMSDFENEKPKGMHWSTYNRLVDEHDFYITNSLNKAALCFSSS